MKNHVLIMLVILFTIASGLTVYTAPENIQKIEIYASYDPAIGEGVVNMKIVFDQAISGNGAIVDIPLLNGTSITIVNVTGDNEQLFPYSYDARGNVLTVYANNTMTINIYYLIEGLMEEVGPNAYSGIIDLSIYNGLSVEASIELSGVYSVDSEPEANIQYSDNTTIIKLDKPDLYVLTIYVSPETLIPPTTTTTTGTTPITITITTVTTTTPTTTAGAGTATTTSPAGVTTVVAGPTTTTPPAGGVSPVTIGVIIIVIIVVIALIIWALKR